METTHENGNVILSLPLEEAEMLYDYIVDAQIQEDEFITAVLYDLRETLKEMDSNMFLKGK